MRTLHIPLTLGRADRIDPKFAPLGVLATAKNLRVRKDGRLASRTGYQPQTMVDCNGQTMTAYDLYEYHGRLCALGSSRGEGYPCDLYENKLVPSNSPWRPTDESGQYRVCVSPFTYPKQVAGIPQPAQGVTTSDCAIGGGYVCLVYTPVGSTLAFIQIVRESDDQVIYCRSTASQSLDHVRVVWETDRFYFLGTTTTNQLRLYTFVPATSTVPSLIATLETSGHSSTLAVFEICPIANASTDKVVVCYALISGSAVTVKRFSSAGVQGGSTLSITAASNVTELDVEADFVDNTVNVVHRTSIGGIQLRTYNFSNTLLDGPTTCTLGVRPRICRLPASAPDSFLEHVAVAVNDSNDNVVIQYIDQDAHTVSNTRTVAKAFIYSRLIAARSVQQTRGVVFGGYVEANTNDDSTNALFYVSILNIHMTTRDLRTSARGPIVTNRALGLAKDPTTGRIAWNTLAALDVGGTVEQPYVTTFDLNTARRRQSAQAGGMMYLTGGPCQVYDGRILTETAFNEVPRIVTTVQGTTGALTQLATYTYVLVWEYHLADGSYYESPPSLPVTVTLTGANDSVDLTVSSPHSVRIALGDQLYGTDVSGVLYRTLWDSVNNAVQGAGQVECLRFSYDGNITVYGANKTVTDIASDASIATNPILYTQGGPVENNAPEANTYISASSSRLDSAGLAHESEFQESKELPLDQAVNFSTLSSFFGRTSEPIKGIISLDGLRIIYTRNYIYGVSGEGAQDDGSGALPPPVEIASPGGLKDWRSLLVAPDGIWFQLDNEKLYRMPRGSGSPSWEGVDIQDTLVSYPVITGATRCRKDDSIVFACQNAEVGTDARMIVRSLRTSLWTEDTVPLQSSKGIEAITSWGDTLAYISGGVVYAQSATSFADNTSTVIVTEVKTHPIYPNKLGGNCSFHDVLLTGEYRSAGTLEMFISYDDGINFTAYDSFTLTGLSVGQTKQLKWAIQQSDFNSLVFRWVYTPSAPGEGFIIHSADLLIDPDDGLKDLDPGDQA